MINLIRQPYHVTVASITLGLHEQRVLLSLISLLQNKLEYKKNIKKVLEGLNGSKTFRIRVKNLMRNDAKKYQEIRNALCSLLRKEIIIEGKDKVEGPYHHRTNLISSFTYYFKNEIVDIEINKKMLGILVGMSAGYTRFSLEIAFNSSSVYTSRLYQFVAHWRDKKNGFEMELKIDRIKAIFGLIDKYKKPNALKKFILEPAQKELKEKADVWFDIKEPIKEGRKIIGWKIKIYKRGDAKEPKKGYQKSKFTPLITTQKKPEKEEKIDPKFLAKSKEKYAERIKKQGKKKKTLKPQIA